MQTTQRGSKVFLGFLLVAPYFFAVSALSNFKGATFESVVVFGIIAIVSLLGAALARQQGVNPFRWFDGKFNGEDLKLMGFGYVALLAAAFGLTALGGSIGIFLALGAGGAILAYILIKPENILVPIIVHGTYNLTAVVLSSFSVIQLSSSPIFVPDYSFGQALTQSILSQAFLQYWLVALSEEAMKVALALGFALFISKDKRVIFGISVTLWVILHSILSFRVV